MTSHIDPCISSTGLEPGALGTKAHVDNSLCLIPGACMLSVLPVRFRTNMITRFMSFSLHNLLNGLLV